MPVVGWEVFLSNVHFDKFERIVFNRVGSEPIAQKVVED